MVADKCGLKSSSVCRENVVSENFILGDNSFNLNSKRFDSLLTEDAPDIKSAMVPTFSKIVKPEVWNWLIAIAQQRYGLRTVARVVDY